MLLLISFLLLKHFKFSFPINWIQNVQVQRKGPHLTFWSESTDHVESTWPWEYIHSVPTWEHVQIKHMPKRWHLHGKTTGFCSALAHRPSVVLIGINRHFLQHNRTEWCWWFHLKNNWLLFFWYWLKYTYWEKNPDLQLIFLYRRDCAT